MFSSDLRVQCARLQISSRELCVRGSALRLEPGTFHSRPEVEPPPLEQQQKEDQRNEPEPELALDRDQGSRARGTESLAGQRQGARADVALPFARGINGEDFLTDRHIV